MPVHDDTNEVSGDEFDDRPEIMEEVKPVKPKPSIESIEADLCGQISTNNSISNLRKPLTDNANGDTIENDNGVFYEEYINKENVNLIKIAKTSHQKCKVKECQPSN